MITVTEAAVAQIKKVKASNDDFKECLRIAVVGGGCSGNSYQMGFDDKQDGDASFETGGLTVVVDEMSLPKVNGLELDFVENLEGSSFVFRNPNSTGGCGCGKSFSC